MWFRSMKTANCSYDDSATDFYDNTMKLESQSHRQVRGFGVWSSFSLQFVVWLRVKVSGRLTESANTDVTNVTQDLRELKNQKTEDLLVLSNNNPQFPGSSVKNLFSVWVSLFPARVSGNQLSQAL